MKQSEQIWVLAQTPRGDLFHHGIKSSAGNSIGLDSNFGLLAMANYQSDIENDVYSKVVEILQDDMQINFPVFEQWHSHNDLDETAARCLKESLQNINEYLLDKKPEPDSDHNLGVEIACLQLTPQKVIVYLSGDFCLLMVNESDGLTRLTAEHHLEHPVSGNLGIDSEMTFNLHEQEISRGDILLLLQLKLLESLGEDFIRMTFLRFQDNLEMAIRQINTRAARNGLAEKPSLASCYVNHSGKSSGGWFSRFK